MVIIYGEGIIIIIIVTKHLGINVKKLKILLWYDFQNGITNEKKMLYVYFLA